MKVLHLASFTGNVGDNANHSGFRRWFETLTDATVEWTDLEIREFYWHERRFDSSFVVLTAGFDLLVIGGGNYFELWVDRSQTGTSIDIAPELFAQIRVPIFFNALGCDEGQGASPGAVEKFRVFMGRLVKSRQYLVTVRNDGAGAVVRKYLPAAVAAEVRTIPDGGFFLDYDDGVRCPIYAGATKIAINLACDMPEVRFRLFDGASGYESFCHEFARFIENLAAARNDIHFVLFPHIHSDLKIIADVVARLGDRLRRTRLTTAPYVTGPEGARALFGLYRHCHLVLGMRFHANVCALGMGIPTIGLCNYPQISLLYNELDLVDRCLDVDRPGFSKALYDATLASLNNLEILKIQASNAIETVFEARRKFEPNLLEWLSLNGLGKAS